MLFTSSVWNLCGGTGETTPLVWDGNPKKGKGWELAKKTKLKITEVRNKIIGRNIQVKPRELLVRVKGLYRLS